MNWFPRRFFRHSSEPADQPARQNPSWEATVAKFSKLASDAQAELLFVGDSITGGWRRYPESWNKHYGRRGALNIGIGGDRTQHLLWRLQNGNLGILQPKLLVLLIGANNTFHREYTASDIAGGIKAIVQFLRERLPSTKILLLGIFPRGKRNDRARRKIAEANELVAGLADGRMILFHDIGTHFLQPDGSISPAAMPDLLHLSEHGYEIWAQAIEPIVADLLDGTRG